MQSNVLDKEHEKTAHAVSDGEERLASTSQSHTAPTADIPIGPDKSALSNRDAPLRSNGWAPYKLGIGLLVLVAIAFQVKIYNQQKQIINRQSAFIDTQAQVEKSFLATENSLRISERAYVGVANLTANFEAREILIILENIGKVPATAINLDANVYRFTPSSSGVGSDDKNEKHMEGSKVSWDAGEVKLFPGSFRMRVPIPIKDFSQEEMNAILAKKETLYVGGTIRYEDGFGNTDKTTFAFEYSPRPNEGWTVNSALSKALNQ